MQIYKKNKIIKQGLWCLRQIKFKITHGFDLKNIFYTRINVLNAYLLKILFDYKKEKIQKSVAKH